MIPGIKNYTEKYTSPGSQVTVVIYSRVSIVLIRELISAQFQRALIPAGFLSLQPPSNRSGTAAGWLRLGWQMPGSWLVLRFALDKGMVMARGLMLI